MGWWWADLRVPLLRFGGSSSSWATRCGLAVGGGWLGGFDGGVLVGWEVVRLQRWRWVGWSVTSASFSSWPIDTGWGCWRLGGGAVAESSGWGLDLPSGGSGFAC
ncbi:hypothetical protein QQ045_010003 [Rhodiola kirilowii]